VRIAALFSFDPERLNEAVTRAATMAQLDPHRTDPFSLLGVGVMHSALPGQLMNTDLVWKFCRLISIRFPERVAALDSLLLHTLANLELPPARRNPALTMAGIENPYVVAGGPVHGYLLAPVILVPCWVSGHFQLYTVNNVTAVITPHEPWPNNAYARFIAAHAPRLRSYITQQRLLARLPAIDYAICPEPPSLPKQGDTNSCGAFVCAYAYFYGAHGRPPTTADFTAQSSDTVRLVVHECVRRGMVLP
jgi:hypothetical protein